MTRPSLRRLSGVLAVAIGFGVAMSVLKGNDSGVRDTIGNVSAPWLLLPFLAGAVGGGRRIGSAALVGTVALYAALGGFYLANSFVLDLGPHPWLDDLRLTVEGGVFYFALALVGGPIFGALGGWWQRRRSTLLGLVAAALLVFEPLAWWLYGRLHRINYLSYPVVWACEVLVGIGACALAARLAQPRRPGPKAAGVVG